VATYNDKIPNKIIERVHKKVHECLKKARVKFPGIGDFCFPVRITFDKKGVVSATADSRQWHLNFNRVLLLENTEDVIKNTIPHEVAHLVTGKVFPRAKQSHGKEWRLVCKTLYGCELSRCHSYSVENARIRKRPLTRHVYHCGCALHLFTKGEHEKTQHRLELSDGKRGAYACGKCNQSINEYWGETEIKR